ncbi:hypothetical protein JCGZ_02387 [Jatropha curcas]|uniref:Aminotransferase-like plant mobile domain-containing protein n=1 Tax=Jatropha curcas TaxID=180498 RepID=A0A067JG14_JATCU|nr:hypothetical protein JCGZ_02387 [Jatropha curcas]
METFGALPDVSTFDGELVLVSRNPLTPGTRPLQLLPFPGTEFPVRATNFKQLRDAAVEWRGAGAEVDLGKASSGGSATDASAFWDLLDPPMQARVVAVGFGDYAAGLRRTQPRFPLAMQYALMERWNDCTHTFVFGFGEMTLTPVDYAAITGLRFTGPVPPLDDRYGHTSTVSIRVVRAVTLLLSLGGFLVIWPIAITLMPLFLTPWDCKAWRTYPGREEAELHTRSRLLMRGYWADRYFLGERVPHAPPRHMCLLEGLTQEDLEAEYRGFSANDFLSVGDFPTYFSSRMQAQLPEILEYTQVPAQRYQEICQRFRFARSYIGRLYSERHERDLEIGRLRRHQSRQSSAVSRLQAEGDRLRTRLEVEGIPLDSTVSTPSGGCWSEP